MPRIAAAIGPLAGRQAARLDGSSTRPQTEAELDAVRRSVRRSSPFGSSEWQRTTAQRLGLQAALRPPGRARRPRGQQRLASRFLRPGPVPSDAEFLAELRAE